MSTRKSLTHVILWRADQAALDARRAGRAARHTLLAERAELDALDALDALRADQAALQAAWAERIVLAEVVVLADRMDEVDVRVAQAAGAAQAARLNAQAARAAQAELLAEQAKRGELRRAKDAQSPSKDKELGSRAARLAPKAAQAWGQFGFFLPPRSKKLLGYDLAEHTSDLFAALVKVGSRGQQDWLILRFTIAAVVKVLDHTRVTLQNRFRDELDWVAKLDWHEKLGWIAKIDWVARRLPRKRI